MSCRLIQILTAHFAHTQHPLRDRVQEDVCKTPGGRIDADDLHGHVISQGVLSPRARDTCICSITVFFNSPPPTSPA